VPGCPQTYLALDAIRKYLEIEMWQNAEIQEAIQRADAGEFATDTWVTAVREKFRANSQT
jgi:predicted transcriptional regulator